MRVLLLGACLGLVSSEQFSLSSGVKAISEHLGAVQLSSGGFAEGQASGHKLGVEALLKTVEKAKALDDVAKTTLGQVSTLLDGILTNLLGAKDTEQPNLEAVNTNVATCQVQNEVDHEAHLLEQSNEAYDNHTECRDEEVLAYDEMKLHCEEVIQGLAGLSELVCTIEVAAEKTMGDDWIIRFEEIKTWFAGAETTLNTKDDLCTDAAEEQRVKREECNEIQEIYESKRCSYTNYYAQRCTNQKSCYDGHVATHNAAVTRIFADANVRCEDAKMITYVKCLVDHLRNTDDTTLDAMTTACESKKTDDYSNYNNTEVTVDAMIVCNADTWNPDADQWQALNYHAIDEDKSPAEELSITCDTIPTPTTPE